MFIFLSKFLPLLVYPLGLAFILQLLSLVLQKNKRWHNKIVVLALVTLWLSSNPWVAFSLVRSLEWQYIPPQEIPGAEVIVVLGGGTDPADYPRQMVEINGGGDRVLYAAKLYKNGKAPNILLSGGNITWLGSQTSTPAQEMAELLEMMEVPENVIWLQSNSQNTYEDALYSSEFLQKKGINRILLVTSATHMPRSVALFEHHGFNVIPAPTDFKVTQAGWQSLTEGDVPSQILKLIPNVGYLSMVTAALKEYFGMAVYKLRGWL